MDLFLLLAAVTHIARDPGTNSQRFPAVRQTDLLQCMLQQTPLVPLSPLLGFHEHFMSQCHLASSLRPLATWVLSTTAPPLACFPGPQGCPCWSDDVTSCLSVVGCC